MSRQQGNYCVMFDRLNAGNIYRTWREAVSYAAGVARCMNPNGGWAGYIVRYNESTGEWERYDGPRRTEDVFVPERDRF